MLRSMKDMEGYQIGATDGSIGKVVDYYFDDEAWVIRYVVVALGMELPHRKVLVSPISINQVDWSGKILPVALTRDQVLGSPDIDTDQPVSRQQEVGYLGYFGYGAYWGGGGLWGAGLYPDVLQAGRQVQARTFTAAEPHREHPHLRSGNTVCRYYVHAKDGDIGHVEGVLIDERTWAIRYLMVNTSNWWLGHQVLIAPHWITEIDWRENLLSVGLTRTEVRLAPHYDPRTTPDRDREAALHRHYERDGYWLNEDQIEAANILGHGPAGNRDASSPETPES